MNLGCLVTGPLLYRLWVPSISIGVMLSWLDKFYGGKSIFFFFLVLKWSRCTHCLNHFADHHRNWLVQDTVNCFLKYYSDRDTRPIFNTVDEMLKWADLYNLTTRTLDEQLVEIGLSPLLIQELVTVSNLTQRSPLPTSAYLAIKIFHDLLMTC